LKKPGLNGRIMSELILNTYKWRDWIALNRKN
jgi:hypothetical protein